MGGYIVLFSFLGAGLFIGYKKLIGDRLIKLNSSSQLLWLLILIFSMGVLIGSDKEMVKMLPRLGGYALGYSLFACVGSVGAVYVISRFFEEDNK